MSPDNTDLSIHQLKTMVLLNHSSCAKSPPPPPLFPPPVWNVHDATLNNDPRTNNICEGWNNKFHNLVGHHHPSIWRVIDWFPKEETTVRIVRQQDNVGWQSKQGRQRYIRMQGRLRNLCADRRDARKTVEQTLRGIGWNIRLNKRTAN